MKRVASISRFAVFFTRNIGPNADLDNINETSDGWYFVAGSDDRAEVGQILDMKPTMLGRNGSGKCTFVFKNNKLSCLDPCPLSIIVEVGYDFNIDYIEDMIDKGKQALEMVIEEFNLHPELDYYKWEGYSVASSYIGTMNETFFESSPRVPGSLYLTGGVHSSHELNAFDRMYVESGAKDFINRNGYELSTAAGKRESGDTHIFVYPL